MSAPLPKDGMGSPKSVSQPELPNFQVRRPDTLQFASLEGLGRMAGVSPQSLRTLITKEVVDNALDEMDRIAGDPGSVAVRREGEDTYIVEDDGGGMPQNLAVLRDLFSTNRPMVSGKFLRRPSRGLLGNGLRVMVGAVALSGGTITVESHGWSTRLQPRRVGETDVIFQRDTTRTTGTRLEFTLGTIIPRSDDDLTNANEAIDISRVAGPPYARLPSPHWLDLDHFTESLATIEPAETTVRQLIERLDGCSGAAAGRLAEPFGKGRTCRSMREPEIAGLLERMQASARVVRPRSLGAIGEDAFEKDYDGYIKAEAWLRTGANEPYAHIPVLLEGWAKVTSRRGGNTDLTIYCNRTPVNTATGASRSYGNIIRLSGAGLQQDGPAVEVEGGNCDLILAVSAPLIPTTSLGKAPDLSALQADIAEVLRRAFTRSRNRLPPDPKEPKPPKAAPPPKASKPPPYQPSGALAVLLAEEANQADMLPNELLVLSSRHDPFNETRASRRNAEWFAEQVARFVPEGRVHLRGLYYRCLSFGEVCLPDGSRFIGSHVTARLIEDAGKYARHLGLVAFDRISDERSAPPEFFDYNDKHRNDANDEPIRRDLVVTNGGHVLIPEANILLPTLAVSVPDPPRQPFRICIIGEKVSLGEVLRPIADEVRGELLLATGEVSETAVYGIARRAAEDGRPLRILYYSDFDPAGWQMPVSVARKLQAHIHREFHDLDVKLVRIALTVEQVAEFNLPDSPIKPTEKRARAWRERWGREQVEIDALAALQPELLDQIARDAVAPYFDPTFEDRFNVATAISKELPAWFRRQPTYREATVSIEGAYAPAVQAIAALNEATAAAIDAMRQVVAKDAPELPEVVVEPEIDTDEPEDTVFDSGDDFVGATLKLQGIKALSPDDEDESGEDDKYENL